MQLNGNRLDSTGVGPRLYETQRALRLRFGGPYRRVLSCVCRTLFERGRIDTAPNVRLHELGLDAPGRFLYAPSGWFFLRRALKGCHITGEDVFVDFGSGMGRAVCLAARNYSFGRVVGVEISQQLNDVAAENLKAMAGKLRCGNVELVTADAVDFTIPDDMTYAYLFNPFQDDVFRAVLANVIASLDRRPRLLTICYANPRMDDVILASGRFRKVRSTTGLRRDHDFQRINVYQSI